MSIIFEQLAIRLPTVLPVIAANLVVRLPDLGGWLGTALLGRRLFGKPDQADVGPVGVERALAVVLDLDLELPDSRFRMDCLFERDDDVARLRTTVSTKRLM